MGSLSAVRPGLVDQSQPDRPRGRQNDDNRKGSVDTAATDADTTAGVVTPASPEKKCKLEDCPLQVPPPARKGQQKDFCSDKHRAAWHLNERRKATQRLMDGLEDLRRDVAQLADRAETVLGEARRLDAVLNGALALIDTTLKVGRKPPRNKMAVTEKSS